MTTDPSTSPTDDRTQLARVFPSLVMAAHPFESVRRPLPEDVISSLDVLWPADRSIDQLDKAGESGPWRADGDLLRLSIHSGGFERQIRFDPDQVLVHFQSSHATSSGLEEGDGESREDEHFVLITPRVAVHMSLCVDRYCDEHFDGQLSAEIVATENPVAMQEHVKNMARRFSGASFDVEDQLEGVYGGDHVPASKHFCSRSP